MSTETAADRLLDLIRELGSLQADVGQLWLLARRGRSETSEADDTMESIVSSFVELRDAIELLVTDGLRDTVGGILADPQCMSLADDPCSDPDRWIAPYQCEVPDAD